jgi:hypothetical protein
VAARLVPGWLRGYQRAWLTRALRCRRRAQLAPQLPGTLIVLVLAIATSAVLDFLGIPPEQTIVADTPTSGTHIVGVDFTKGELGKHHEPHGSLKLYVDDQVVADDEIRTLASRYRRYTLCGEGLCIGYDGGDAVSSQYTPQFEFTGGRIGAVLPRAGG